MARLAAGEDRALDELMARWSARLISFLVRLTGDHATACDLAQETFVRIYQSRDRFRSGGTFGAFLFQIAANLARNHARWRHRHPEVSMEEEPMPEPADDAHGAPDRVAESDETAAAVRSAVLALPEDLRQPLVLSVYEGRNQDEIAEILGCTRKAVEMRVYRARQILRGQLAAFVGK
jgi:RNA polymerase sigma-70 factor (ECF subfamily)